MQDLKELDIGGDRDNNHRGPCQDTAINAPIGWLAPQTEEVATLSIVNATDTNMGLSSENCIEWDPTPSYLPEHPPEPTTIALAYPQDEIESTLSMTQIPGVWSYEYQMGPSVYQWAVSRESKLRQSGIAPLAITNSSFSDHITLIECLVMENWCKHSSKTQTNVDSYVLGCSCL
jgi:hypothetical protein